MTTTHRTTARVVGALFIAADVAGVLSLVLQPPHLQDASAHPTAAATSALLLLAMGMAVLAIAIAIYPVLRQFRERLALAYVAVRAMEGMVNVIGAIGALTLLSVAQLYAGAVPPDASLQSLGGVLLAERDWVNNGVLPIVFALDALILNYVLFEVRLVPRWLSIWGLGAAALWLAAGVLTTYGVKSLTGLAAPIGLQEIALALWLIFMGFNPAAFAASGDERLGERPAVIRTSVAGM